MMYNAGHSVVFPLAYYPVDGPIEYIFNQVEMGLRRRLYHIGNEQDLVRNLYSVPIGNISAASIDAIFVHCGY